MTINLPYKVRAGIYITIALGTAVLVPLHQFDYIPEVAMAIWTSLSGAASLLAALNVQEDI